MDESFVLSLSAGHVWQGPIPARELPRLKSFARIGLKGFWGKDYDEAAHYQFIPTDQAEFAINIESDNDELYDIFNEEYELKDFPIIEIIFDDQDNFTVNIPLRILITSHVFKQIYVEIENIKKYIEYVNGMSLSQDGFSEVSLEHGGFKCDLDLTKYGMPKDIKSIFPVVVRGSTKIGTFDYLIGIIFDKYYFSLSTLGNDGDCDLFYHTYFDDDLNFMMSFSQWFAGCDVGGVGDKYKSSISDDLIDAYLSTNFHVYAGDEFVLNIGQFSRSLRSLHEAHDCDTSAIVTGWNPLGVPLSDAENQKQNEKLKDIAQERYSIFEAAGVDTKQEWPAEASFLILGISRHDVMDLGHRFQQNAIVFNEDTVPELIMLR